MRKYTARMLFRDFREAYPELWCRGCYYTLTGHMQLTISIPNKGKVIFENYEWFGNKLTWLEKWEDPEEIKKRNKFLRNNSYEYFLERVGMEMVERGLTQRDIAEISGISRKSINEYLGRRAKPKLSTMKRICDSLNIDF